AFGGGAAARGLLPRACQRAEAPSRRRAYRQPRPRDRRAGLRRADGACPGDRTCRVDRHPQPRPRRADGPGGEARRRADPVIRASDPDQGGTPRSGRGSQRKWRPRMPRTTALALSLVALVACEAAAADLDLGRTTFAGACAACHGAEAKGDGPMAELISIPVPD